MQTEELSVSIGPNQSGMGQLTEWIDPIVSRTLLCWKAPLVTQDSDEFTEGNENPVHD